MSNPSSLRRHLLSALALTATVPFAHRASAQGAGGPVSLIVPYAPGGPSDLAARLIRPSFEAVLGRTTIVENVPGAGGSIGAARALRVTDGTQILLATPNETILAPLGLAAVKFKPDAFRLVGTLGELPYALIARADIPSKSLDELIAFMRANSARPLAYGSMGPGSMNHLATEAFRRDLGLNLNHIPYKGAAPLVQDILAGQLDFALTPLAGNVLGLIETGKVKFFGVTTAQRTTRYKDWPTLNEGRSLKDFVLSIWFGPMVSKDTPEPVVQRIQAALAEAMRQPDVRKSLADAGFVEPAIASLAEADKLYAAEQLKFRRIADDIKLQPQ